MATSSCPSLWSTIENPAGTVVVVEPASSPGPEPLPDDAGRRQEDPDVLSGAPPQSSSCAASASTDSMNSSTMSNTTWREVLDTFMVPTTWPTK